MDIKGIITLIDVLIYGLVKVPEVTAKLAEVKAFVNGHAESGTNPSDEEWAALRSRLGLSGAILADRAAEAQAELARRSGS